MSIKKFVAATAAVLGLSVTGAMAQSYDYYVSGSLGMNFQNDSSNEGVFSEDFTINATSSDLNGATLDSGTPVGWETEFDNGYVVNGAWGFDTGAFRGELELSYQAADVDTHTDVSAGGIALDAADATVLVAGTADDLGVTVGDLVAAGEGEITGTYVFANGYFDFETNTAITPYIGGGIGFGSVNVEYAPSNTGIIDDDDTVFAYQVMAGASYEVADGNDLFATVRYRASEDVEVDADLFPATFEVENESVLLEVGYRYTF